MPNTLVGARLSAPARLSEKWPMAKVEIYTSMLCGYCHAAKRLLKERGAQFTEYDVGCDAERRARMSERAGGRTSVPQIFIDGRYIGGCDELHDLDRAGKLTPLLVAP
jgi:glutaredoxin 3